MHTDARHLIGRAPCSGGVIQVTRCIGDRPLRHLGLTSEPELTRVEVKSAHRSCRDFLLLYASSRLPPPPSSSSFPTTCSSTNTTPHLLSYHLPHAPPRLLCQIGPTDKMLVLASDGLWDVMTHERVLHCLKNTAKSPDLIAKRLLTEALDRGTTDNTSVAVCFLRDLE